MRYKIVCFDVDGTLVDNLEYSWQVFHDNFKVDTKRRDEAKKKFYSGQISYVEWAEHDLNMWKEVGKKRKDFVSAIEDSGLKLMKGAYETLKELKKNGIRLAIVSGSISIILEHLIPDYKELFSDVYLSSIDFSDEGDIKEIKVTSYDMEKKADALREIAEKEKVELSECVFVGDHHNDVMIAKEAGFSIAFNCKDDNLREVSDVNILKKDLREILKYVLVD